MIRECGGAVIESFDDPQGLYRQYRLLIDHSPDAIVVHEGDKLVFVNPAGLRLIGATSHDQVTGHPIAEFVNQQSIAALFERIVALDEQGAASEPTEMVLRRIGGQLVDVEARSVRTMWAGKPAYLAVLRDLTAQKEAEAAVAAAESEFTTVVSTLVEGVIILDGDGIVKSINAAARTILGVGEEIVDATGDKRLIHHLTPTLEDGSPLTPDRYSWIRSQPTGMPVAFVNRVQRTDGTIVWTKGTTQVISAGLHPRLVVSFSDITDDREASVRLEYQANHDSLTDLPNRLHVVDTLTATLADADRGPVAVLFLDLDNLKTVNDSLGHSVGDDVLRITGERLRFVVPADGIVGRVGGDEFVAVIHGDDGYVDDVGESIHAALAEPIELDGWTLGITASIGVVQVPVGDSRTIDDLLRDADLAMYSAKEAGGQRTVRFSPLFRRDRSSK